MAMRRPTGQNRRMVPAPDSRPKPPKRKVDQIGKLPLQPERSFADQVVKAAELLGWRVYRTWNSQHSPAGFPDLCMVRRPRIIFAELKRQDKGPTPDQVAWLDDLRASGQEAYLWRPSDWPEIERVLGVRTQ